MGADTTGWDDHRAPPLELIDDCVHCGFCLTSCPSYSVFENEMDSPRGRIVLMRVGHEPGESLSPEIATHFDRCLGCMACVTSCPSGVQYDRLLERARPQLERAVPGSRGRRWLRRAVFAVFTHPGRLRVIVPALAILSRPGLRSRLARLTPPGRSRTMVRLAPRVRARAAFSRLPSVVRARDPIRGRVALMQGCVQRTLFGDVNAATARVLAAEGWEVHAPRRPRCCGALPLHSGVEGEATRLAKRTIAATESFDLVVTNVAGCGSAMKEYRHLLEDEPEWAERAARFSDKVRDVHELLAAHVARAPRGPVHTTVAYHDACHLAHAQGIRRPPRELLEAIPGLQLVEPREWELCCGSAGVYNVMEPEAAAELGRRKAANLTETGADVIAAANPGCVMQITAHLDGNREIPVHHPVTLLDLSISRGGGG